MTEQQALFEELLIEEVHKYEHLWKAKSKNFKDVERTNNSWKEIASTIQSVGVTASDDACKKKWKYLRDSYARLKRECSSKSGDGAQSTSRNVCWKFYWCLSFPDDATSATQRTTVNSTGGSQDFEDENSNETMVGETPPAPKRRSWRMYPLLGLLCKKCSSVYVSGQKRTRLSTLGSTSVHPFANLTRSLSQKQRWIFSRYAYKLITVII